MNDSLDAHSALRRSVYWLLIAVSVGMMTGRVFSVKSQLGKTPLLSANDRSRWCTVRSLVDHGTYQIDAVIFAADGRRDREWYTIDMVRHRGRDGREHYYSSKPPLMPTLLAAKYWLLQEATGVTLAAEPFYVIRLLLLTTNVLPMMLYFVLLALLIERLGTTDWGRIFVMVVATLGTFLTTFSVTLNNHLPGAISVLIATYAAVRIVRDGRREWHYFVLAGTFAAFAAANELPALSFLGLLGAVLLWQYPRQTLLAGLPAATLVAAASFLTNYAAHADWRPPYAHRSDGPVIATIASLPEFDATFLETPAPASELLRQSLVALSLSDQATLELSDVPNRWVLWDPEQQRRWALVRQADVIEVCDWDNWYEYERSYWTAARKTGVDRGEQNPAVYAFHVLVGHHGLFSLTPVWLLSIVGGAIWLRRGDPVRRGTAVMVLLLTAVCLVFYLSRPLADRNYGGVSTGFRWMFWFTPLWLLLLLPAADALSHSTSLRRLAWMLLAVSVLSATYGFQNPWTHSWIYDYWSHLEWIRY